MTPMTSERTCRTDSFEGTSGELRRKFHAAFSMSTAETACGTVFRTIIAFASCVFAAAFGGVALVAWKTTLSLIAAKWSAQVETPATGEWESDAADVDTRGPGCEQKRDEHSEHTASQNWVRAFALLHPNEVKHAELIQIHNAQDK